MSDVDDHYILNRAYDQITNREDKVPTYDTRTTTAVTRRPFKFYKLFLM